MPPGTYNLTLQVGDKEYTQELQVLKDPHSKGTEEDIRLQTEMMLELHKDMSALADSSTVSNGSAASSGTCRPWRRS